MPAATKTAKSAISDTPLAKKMLVKPGRKVGLIGAPEGTAAVLAVLLDPERAGACVVVGDSVVTFREGGRQGRKPRDGVVRAEAAPRAHRCEPCNERPLCRFHEPRSQSEREKRGDGNVR